MRLAFSRARRDAPAIIGDATDEDVGVCEVATPEGHGADITGLAAGRAVVGDVGAQLTAPALWVGDSASGSVKHGATLVDRDSAMTPINTGEYTSSMFNTRAANNMLNAPSGVVVMATMLVGMATEVAPDWRLLGIKTVLLDAVREVVTTDVTGVPWTVALNQDRFSVRVNTNEMEQWGFSAVFISLRYLECFTSTTDKCR